MCSGACVRGWVLQEAETNRQGVHLQEAEQLSLHWRRRGEVLQLERGLMRGSPAGYSILSHQRVPPAPDRCSKSSASV
jgi:hypothetical protein